MKFFRKSLKLFSAALLAAGTVSCVQNPFVEGNAVPGEMRVSATLDDIWLEPALTKAPAMRSLSGSLKDAVLFRTESGWELPEDFPSEGTKSAPVSVMHSTMALSGYGYSGSWSGSVLPNICYRKTLTNSGGNWLYDGRMMWPGDDMYVRFYGVSPATASGLSWSASNVGGAPTITYTASTTVASQVDILDAVSDEDTEMAGIQDYVGDGSDDGGNIPLVFRHALTAVKFRANAFGAAVRVKTITLSGVYGTGVHEIGSTVWTSHSNVSTYTVSPAVDVTVDGTDIALTGGATEMLLIPQTCPAGAMATVVVTWNGNDYTLECDLEDEVWAAGKEITYTVSLDGSDWVGAYVDLADFNVDGLTDGSSRTVATVLSYRQHVSGIRTALPWTLEFSTDGGNSWSSSRPGMLSSFSTSGTSGGWTGESFSVVPSSRSTGTFSPAGTFSSPQGTSSSPVDLSLVHPVSGEAMARETANCYVVKGPGYYRIPLIYGAAVVNGSDNLSAAAPAGTFKNAFGNNISNGNIVTDVGAANLGDAHLEWQTAAGLVSVEPELELDGGVYYLKFQVPAATIREGSALVGVLKDGSADEYVWSWLVWVVSGEMAMGTDTYTNAASLDIDMLNWPLGGTRTPNTGKPARSCMVKISNAYAERTFTLSQEAVVTSTGNPVCTYYQWGMPCALPPGGTLYDAAGSTYTFNYDSGNSVTDVAGTISKPQLPRWENSHLGTAYNNWDADMSTASSDQPVNKTVYDPSPAGFSVPRYAFATGFSTANVVGSFNKGYTFKRTTSDTEGRFLGACGFRAYVASVYDAGNVGYFWSAAAYTNSNGRQLFFYSGVVSPQYYSSRFFGFGVRSAVWPE